MFRILLKCSSCAARLLGAASGAKLVAKHCANQKVLSLDLLLQLCALLFIARRLI